MWVFALIFFLWNNSAASVQAQQRRVPVPTINVRLKPGSTISDLDGIAPKAVEQIRKAFSFSDAELNSLAQIAAARSGKVLPNLNLWQTIKLHPKANPKAALEEIKANEHVDIAELVISPPHPPGMVRRRRKLNTTPDYESLQTYLGPAPGGINARYGWTKAGGTGANVKVYDIEYSWNQGHEDLNLNVPLLVGRGNPSNPFPDAEDHGTAVLGQLIGNSNSRGVLGIAYDADIGLCPEYTEEFGSVRGDAILQAVNDGTAGDIILLEMQARVCDMGEYGYGPAEWEQVVFDATSVATAAGFVVVAAAGNGNVNLDLPSCFGKFDPFFRDSGAIIVGAGAPPKYLVPRSKLEFSSYGSRVDVQGWGRDVVTAAYGDLFKDPDNFENRDRWYTQVFSGTSSASPIVAGAAAIMQSYSIQQYNSRLTSIQIRQIFRDTGTPQEGDTSQRIGSLPDLEAAICEVDKLFGASCDGDQTIPAPSAAPSTSAAPTTSPVTIALADGIPLTGQTASANDITFYILEPISAGDEVRCTTSGGTDGDADLAMYYQYDPDSICISNSLTSDESCLLGPATIPTTLYAEVLAYEAFSALTITCSTFTSPDTIPLTDGVPATGQSAAAGTVTTYTLDPIFSGDQVACTTFGASGDADIRIYYLYDPSSFCISEQYTSDEDCSLGPAVTDTTLYAEVTAFGVAYTGLSITCTVFSNPGTIALTDGVPETGQSAAAGVVTTYILDPVLASYEVSCTTTGGTDGDADLKIYFAYDPANSCVSLSFTSEEACSLGAAVTNTTLYAEVTAYTAYTGLVLSCSTSAPDPLPPTAAPSTTAPPTTAPPTTAPPTTAPPTTAPPTTAPPTTSPPKTAPPTAAPPKTAPPTPAPPPQSCGFVEYVRKGLESVAGRLFT